jgi:hypothetical protein
MGFMGRAHLLVGAGVALTTCLYLGCASKPKSAAQRHLHPHSHRQGAAPAVSDGSYVPSLGRPADAPASAVEVAPRSIAQHAEAYAQNLESLLAKRGAATLPPQTQPAAAHSTKALEATPDKLKAAANASLKVEPEQPATAPAALPPVASTAPPRPSTQPVAADVGRDAKPQPAGDAAAQPAASRSTATVTAPSTAPTADQLLQKFTTRVKEYPRDPVNHLEYQLLQLLRDQPVPELSSIASLPTEDRQILTTLLDGLSNFRSALRAESNMLQSKKIAPLLEMGDRLRAQGELTIPNSVLCTNVDRFGVYEPMEPATFKAGQNNVAVLYVEVANFSSVLNGRQQWETRLKHEGVLYSETGLNVWQDQSDTVVDVSRNRRHDFYVVEKLRLPNLPVGRYLLKVTVTDLQVSRVAEATVPIQVVAK